MELQLETISSASPDVMLSSRGNAPSESNSNHSPTCSNDSGFHSDLHVSENHARTLPARTRPIPHHKPTYVSVFATDTNDSAHLLNQFGQRLSGSRPTCLSKSLKAPEHIADVQRSISPINLPLISPSTRYTSNTLPRDSSSSRTKIVSQTTKPMDGSMRDERSNGMPPPFPVRNTLDAETKNTTDGESPTSRVGVLSKDAELGSTSLTKYPGNDSTDADSKLMENISNRTSFYKEEKRTVETTYITESTPAAENNNYLSLYPNISQRSSLSQTGNQENISKDNEKSGVSPPTKSNVPQPLPRRTFADEKNDNQNFTPYPSKSSTNPESQPARISPTSERTSRDIPIVPVNHTVNSAAANNDQTSKSSPSFSAERVSPSTVNVPIRRVPGNSSSVERESTSPEITDASTIPLRYNPPFPEPSDDFGVESLHTNSRPSYVTDSSIKRQSTISQKTEETEHTPLVDFISPKPWVSRGSEISSSTFRTTSDGGAKQRPNNNHVVEETITKTFEKEETRIITKNHAPTSASPEHFGTLSSSVFAKPITIDASDDHSAKNRDIDYYLGDMNNDPRSSIPRTFSTEMPSSTELFSSKNDDRYTSPTTKDYSERNTYYESTTQKISPSSSKVTPVPIKVERSSDAVNSEKHCTDYTSQSQKTSGLETSRGSAFISPATVLDSESPTEKPKSSLPAYAPDDSTGLAQRERPSTADRPYPVSRRIASTYDEETTDRTETIIEPLRTDEKPRRASPRVHSFETSGSKDVPTVSDRRSGSTRLETALKETNAPSPRRSDSSSSEALEAYKAIAGSKKTPRSNMIASFENIRDKYTDKSTVEKPSSTPRVSRYGSDRSSPKVNQLIEQFSRIDQGKPLVPTGIQVKVANAKATPVLTSKKDIPSHSRYGYAELLHKRRAVSQENLLSASNPRTESPSLSYTPYTSATKPRSSSSVTSSPVQNYRQNYSPQGTKTVSTARDKKTASPSSISLNSKEEPAKVADWKEQLIERKREAEAAESGGRFEREWRNHVHKSIKPYSSSKDDDSTQSSASDNGKAASDSSKAASDGGKAASDSGKMVSDSGKVAIDSGKGTNDSGKERNDVGKGASTMIEVPIRLTGAPSNGRRSPVRNYSSSISELKTGASASSNASGNNKVNSKSSPYPAMQTIQKSTIQKRSQRSYSSSAANGDANDIFAFRSTALDEHDKGGTSYPLSTSKYTSRREESYKSETIVRDEGRTPRMEETGDVTLQSGSKLNNVRREAEQPVGYHRDLPSKVEPRFTSMSYTSKFEETKNLSGQQSANDTDVLGRPSKLLSTPPPAVEPRCNHASEHKEFGLDISRFNDIKDEDIIGRPVEEIEAEERLLANTPRGFVDTSSPPTRGQATPEQLVECRKILGDEFSDFDIFTVSLKKSANSIEGSVGLILSSATPTNRYITIRRILTGSIAGRNDCINIGDRVFFIQNQSTAEMSSGEARQLLRDATSVITLVLGRSLKSFTPAVATPLEVYQSELVDPATFKFSPEMQEVIIEKVGRGAGFSLGGGVRSVFGDRPIVVKKVYEGGSAEKSGRLKAGDKIVAIDGIDISGMTYVEASKVLKARPDGPILLSIYSRVK